jgi:predicted 3-demethylubiquinone-9 3-methyltransferase (glyoxalase superfamily)
VQCGWLKDKFGLSWQIVPAELDDLVGGKDPARGERVMAALLQMKKLDLKKLRAAAKK